MRWWTALWLMLVGMFVGATAWGSPPPEDDPEHPRTSSIPGDGSRAFPADGAPLVRWEVEGTTQQYAPAVEPRLVGPEREIEVEIEVRTFGETRWLRLHPAAPLSPGEPHRIVATSPWPEDLDTVRIPEVAFRPGPPADARPPPEAAFDLRVTERPCGCHRRCRRHEIAPSPETDDPWSTLRLFEEFPTEPATDKHIGYVDGGSVGWTSIDRLSAWDEVVCLWGVREDAYGRVSEPTRACAEVVEEQESDDCGAADQGVLLALLGLFPCGLLRRRPDGRPGS